ncbi:methylmalonyl-CoA mutase family protein [Salinarimonas sp. NSM]|uniref:methylmalonyl-CoA mutase family protein n=1 Tax=Salinarimonas sp. NSM TaxID=3458003 RepID=UPI0040352DF5
MDDDALSADFPTPSRADWLALVEGVLKGADFEKRLVSRSYDGLAIQPLYDKADVPARPGRAAHGPWRVAQRVDDPRRETANAQALEDLEGGADALTLVFPQAPAARGFGLAAQTVDDLDAALAGVMLDLVHVRLDAGGAGRQAAGMLIALAERRGHLLADLAIDLALDPIGAAAAAGRMSAPWEIVAERSAQTLADLTARGFTGRTFLADARPVHEAGASEAQELAFVLASGVAYLRALEAGGHTPDAARDALSFLLVADADELLGIAKFRALRALWARVEEASGLVPKPIRLHAETAWRMTTRRDPWVNMLRATVATFSAGVGGADSLVVTPFTAALGLPDAFARRVARNTQLVLLHESNLWRVADPAAGSGALEGLTDALCERAWALFQEIEAEGGIVESLRAGALQDRIRATRAARDAAIARRKDAITGVSEFPFLDEKPVAVSMVADDAPHAPPPSDADATATPVAAFGDLVAAAAEGARLARLMAAPAGVAPVTLGPLPRRRDAEPYERLRDRSDALFASHGRRPAVFLANIGPLSAFNARAGFARGAFEAGGIAALSNDGFPDHAAMAEAFAASGAAIACLCSSDALYETEAAAAAQAMKAAGCTRLYLAGRPGAHEAAWREAGVDAFVYMGVDLLGLLEDALARAEEAARG